MIQKESRMKKIYAAAVMFAVCAATVHAERFVNITKERLTIEVLGNDKQLTTFEVTPFHYHDVNCKMLKKQGMEIKVRPRRKIGRTRSVSFMVEPKKMSSRNELLFMDMGGQVLEMKIVKKETKSFDKPV